MHHNDACQFQVHNYDMRPCWDFHVGLSPELVYFVRRADDERHFVSHVLAFFAASDGIVVENLGVRFMSGELLAAPADVYQA